MVLHPSMEYYSAIKMNKVLYMVVCGGISQRRRENIVMPNEISQRQILWQIL
jgi:hypothetical protein